MVLWWSICGAPVREPGDLMRFKTLGWHEPVEICARIVIEVTTLQVGPARCCVLNAAGRSAYGTSSYKELGAPLIRARHVKQ